MLVPRVVVEILRRREAVLVAGPGCGALAGVPRWPALIDALAGQVPASALQRQARDLAAGGRAEAALALLVTELGTEAAGAVVAAQTGGDRAAPPELVALAAAPWRAVLTTGFDPVWTRAHEVAGAETLELVAGRPIPDAAAALDEDVRLLVHLLGCAGDPATLCLAPGDLREHVVDTGLGDVIADLARRCSFIFVGFEPGDPDLGWVAGRLIGAAGGDRPHYVLCSGASRLETALLGAAAGLEAIATPGPIGPTLEALAAAAGPRARQGKRRGRPPRGKRVLSQARVRAIRRWRRAADTLERLADLDRDPDAQAMYLYAAALIHRDRMGDRRTATGLLDRALELDPALVPAWEALARLVDADVDLLMPEPTALAPRQDEPREIILSDLIDDERVVWAARLGAGARRGQA